jgi:hypothetical protein
MDEMVPGIVYLFSRMLLSSGSEENSTSVSPVFCNCI